MFILQQVGTNGYFTFTDYTGYAPFIFNEYSLPLVAPFFTDIDISYGIGKIHYEIHTEDTSESFLSQVNSVINEHARTDFKGRWMLVATWDQVPPFGAITSVSFYKLALINFIYIICFFRYSTRFREC